MQRRWEQGSWNIGKYITADAIHPTTAHYKQKKDMDAIVKLDTI